MTRYIEWFFKITFRCSRENMAVRERLDAQLSSNFQPGLPDRNSHSFAIYINLSQMTSPGHVYRN